MLISKSNSLKRGKESPTRLRWQSISGSAAFRELFQTTLVGLLGYSHLEGDQRLFLFLRRRIDERYTASLAATFRMLQYKGFAPTVWVVYERNDSSVGLNA